MEETDDSSDDLKRQLIIVYYFNTLSAPYRHQSGARSPSHRTPPVARRTFLRKLRHRALLGSIPYVLHQTRANPHYVAAYCYRAQEF